VKALQWAMEAMAEHGVRCVHSHEASRRLRISVHYTRASSLSVSLACVSWGLLEQREHGSNYEGGDVGGGEARVSQRAAGSATGGGEDDARAGPSGRRGVSEGGGSGGGGGGGCRAAATGGGGGGARTGNAARRVEAAGGASSAGQQRRASCRAGAPPSSTPTRLSNRRAGHRVHNLNQFIDERACAVARACRLRVGRACDR
jgi:hypothetical protein